MTIEEQFEAKHIKAIIAYNRKIEAVLNQASKDLAKKISIFELKNPTTISQGSFYVRNKGLEKQIDTILGKLRDDIEAYIGDGVVSQWDMANLKNNKLVGKWADGIKLTKNGIPTSFNQLNMGALDTFLARTTAGLKISDRVWNLVAGAKDQIELYLASGISTGRSAAGIARDVKMYLNEPNRLFRRVRQDGKLVLSKAAKGYHPGAGIYRSSYKNALRLTKNEVNVAYRLSDYTRRQQLDFITGIEVHLSADHPEPDMCDELAGEYPKGFIFDEWHIGCICYTTSIMLSESDSLKYMETGNIDRANYINKIPEGAQAWLSKNAEKLAGYKNMPDWIGNNFTKGFELKDSITGMNIPGVGVTEPAGGGFVPAKSIEEAERHITDKLKLENAYYKGINIDYANEINETLVKLKNKYPKMDLGRINYYDMGDPNTKGFMSLNGYAKKEGDIMRGSLNINKAYFKNFSSLKDLNAKILSIHDKNFFVAKNLGETVVHEMGHTLTYTGLKSQEAQAIINTLRRKAGLTNISKYAESNLMESIAEAFIKYDRGDELTPNVLKLLKEYLGVK